MKQYKDLLKHDNLRISNYSPRNPGEHESRSHWIEEKDFHTVYRTVQDRIDHILECLEVYNLVWLRVSTKGHHARLFFRKD